jgi:hypothetical protein
MPRKESFYVPRVLAEEQDVLLVRAEKKVDWFQSETPTNSSNFGRAALGQRHLRIRWNAAGGLGEGGRRRRRRRRR